MAINPHITVQDRRTDAKRRPPVVLCVAGSDPSGGAGIQGDIKTCCHFGVYSMGVITALTVQNTLGVKTVRAVDSHLVYDQMRDVVEDIRPDAVKIGMLPNAKSVKEITRVIKEYNLRNVVVDPLLRSSSGQSMNNNMEATMHAMCKELFPLAVLVTPNIPEAKAFYKSANSLTTDETIALELFEEWGCTNLLLKGGHSESEMLKDILFYRDCNGHLINKTFSNHRIDSCNTHGTGCALSTGVACGLACGQDIEIAVSAAISFVHSAIECNVGIKLGNGHGPLNFFINQ